MQIQNVFPPNFPPTFKFLIIKSKMELEKDTKKGIAVRKINLPIWGENWNNAPTVMEK